jgi:hypothetical protein
MEAIINAGRELIEQRRQDMLILHGLAVADLIRQVKEDYLTLEDLVDACSEDMGTVRKVLEGAGRIAPLRRRAALQPPKLETER